MFSVSLEHFLFLGAILFTIGILGIFLNKKNVIVIFFLKLIIQILLMIMMAKKRPSTLSCQGLL